MYLSRRDELEIVSKLGGSLEKALFQYPAKKEKAPLVVGLHTWSYDRFNQIDQNRVGFLCLRQRGANSPGGYVQLLNRRKSETEMTLGFACK